MGKRIATEEKQTELIQEIHNLNQEILSVSEYKNAAQAAATTATTKASEASTSAAAAAASASDADTTATALTTWLADKEELTAPVVDPALTFSGAAADAKVAGSFFKQHSDLLKNVSQNRKNLFNPLALMVPGVSFQNGEYVGTASAFASVIEPFVFAGGENGYLTASFEAYVEPTQGTSGIGLAMVFYTDTNTTSFQINVPNSTDEWTQFSGNKNRWNNIARWKFAVSSNRENIIHIRNIQIENANEATAYEYPLTARDLVLENYINQKKDNLALLDDIKKMAYNANKYFEGQTNSDIFTQADSAYNYADGSIYYTSGIKASDKILLLAGDSISYKVYTANQTLALLAVFDIYGNYIKDKSKTKLDGINNWLEGTFVAEDDCYVGFSCNTPYLSQSYVKLSVKNIEKRVDDLDNELPSYWNTYLSTKGADINSFLSDIGGHGDYFLLFTDYHYTQNTGWTPRIIKRLCKHFGIPKAFNLGDFYNAENSKDDAIERLNTLHSLFYGVNLFNAIGNHDLNPYGGSGNDITVNDMYAPMFKDYEDKYNVSMSSDGYYYLDNHIQKIRYIILNTRTNGFTVEDDTYQLPWFVQAMNSVPSGWYICVCMHMGFEWYGDGTTEDPYHVGLYAAGYKVKTIANAYQNRQSGTTGNVSYDFTSAVGKVACVLSGHAHINTYVDSEAGYYIIGFDRDGLMYPPPIGDATRTEGNITEQSIALVGIDLTAKKVKCLGIGAGVDREFTFD